MGVLRHGLKNRKLMSALPSAYFMAGKYSGNFVEIR